MDRWTFIFIVFGILSIHLSLVVSEESKNLPLPKLEELQLPLLPIEEGQSDSKNGDIQQQKSAVSSVRNKTSEGSVTDVSTLFSTDVDDKDSYSDEDIEEVSSQPNHVTESNVQSEETATDSPTKEDDLTDPMDIEQQNRKQGGNRQQMPSSTQEFPPGQTKPSWFGHSWPNDTLQDSEMSDNSDADHDGVDGFNYDLLDDDDFFYFFDYDDDMREALAELTHLEESEGQGENQISKQDQTVASSDYMEQSVGHDQDQSQQDHSQSEQDVSKDVDWKLFKSDSDDDDDEEELVSDGYKESVGDDGAVTGAGVGDEKQALSHDHINVDYYDDDGYDYDSYDDNENDSINNSTDEYKDEKGETIDRIDEESADDIAGKDTNLDDGDSNFANNESDDDDDKEADITRHGENLDDNDSNSISWESDEDDDNTAHNITGNRENMNNNDDDGFSDIASPEEADRYYVRIGSEKDDSDKDGKLEKVGTESEEEDYKSDKDESQEDDDNDPSKEHNGAVVDHDAEEEEDDADDDEYFVWSDITKYQDKNEDLEDEKDVNENDDDDDEEFDETSEDFAGGTYEFAKKSKQPTAPSSMILFYTWMIVAVLIVIIIISTYRAHCKGFRFLGMKSALDRRDDRKRLIEHEPV